MLTVEPTRKLTPKGQATRERIVAAAAALLQAHGVARTTTEDVREAAGVSASQLYHYFADKMSLVRAVVAYQANAVMDAQAPHLDRLDSLPSLRAWRDALVAIQRSGRCEGGCPLGSLAAELAENEPEARADLAAAFERWEERLRAGLRTMHERGELRPGTDPDRLATALLAAVQGGLLLTQIRRTPRALEDAVDTVLDHIASLVV